MYNIISCRHFCICIRLILYFTRHIFFLKYFALNYFSQNYWKLFNKQSNFKQILKNLNSAGVDVYKIYTIYNMCHASSISLNIILQRLYVCVIAFLTF